MAYADFDYYSDTYHGTAIAESDFPRLALLASAYIDQYTFNRAADVPLTDTTTYTALQNATCALAEELQTQATSISADGIQSESQGQYSVTYAAGSSRSLTNTMKIVNILKLWLTNTGLLYAGFNSGEYGRIVE